MVDLSFYRKYYENISKVIENSMNPNELNELNEQNEPK